MTEREIFLQAIEMNDPAERAATVERACAGQPELRQAVERLLKAHELAGTFLNEPHPAAAEPERTGSYVPDAPAESAGMVIAGKYKLLQKIGEGGMGSVWMADQLEPVKRRVAVKLIRAEREGSHTILSRFEAERQAIALMDHPNIAKLLDAGTIQEPRTTLSGSAAPLTVVRGSPFFVMELVKGTPLTEYCDEHKLSITDRLKLFMQICSAVQHAHQKGIIHRDLKPTNILVESHDDKPVPKVIDFGMAKALSGHALTEHTLFTGFGTVAGTPLYMAPEQAKFNAIDIDTRADIYALGVILYELLTGSTPIERATLKKAALDEILRVIRESEPPAPSKRLSSTDSKPSIAAVRQTEPVKLGRFVKGELDWIVMKALSKERDRRYETANGFAKDVERFLNHEPIVAGPPSAGYKLRKFAQRNKVQVTAACLVLFALVAGVIGTSLGLLEARRQTEFAKAQEAEARRQEGIAQAEKKRAIEFRDQALDALRATTSTDVELLIAGKLELGANEKAYLEAIANRWQEFAKQEGTDEQARAIRAEGLFQVACLLHRLGRQVEARSAYEQASVIREKLAADFPAVRVYLQDLAASHNNLGQMLHDLGQQQEAKEQYGKALVIWGKLAADFPTVPVYRQRLAASHNNLGLLLAGLGQRPEAEEQYRRALQIQEKLVADFPAEPLYRQDLGMSHNNLGNLFEALGRRLEGKEQFRKGLANEEKLVADFPKVPAYRQDLARSHLNLGVLFGNLGQRPEAEEQYLKGQEILEKLAADFPTKPAYRQLLAMIHNNLGNLLSDHGQSPEAEEQYRKALAINEKLATDFPAVPAYRQKLAMNHNNLGTYLRDLGKRPEAEDHYRKALAIQEKLAADFRNVPEYRRDLTMSYHNLGILLSDLDRWSEAEEQYRKAVAIREKLVADARDVVEYRVLLGSSYLNYGRLMQHRGKPAESLPWFDRAIETTRAVHEKDPRDFQAKSVLRKSYWARAAAHDQLKKYTEEVKDWDRLIELCPPAEQDGPRVRRTMSRLYAGLVAEAVAEVTEFTKSSNWTAVQWYDFACAYSVASSKITDKKQEYADRAMELLHEAARAGYKNAAHMKKDKDLDALRGREDFKKLMAELEKKVNKK